MYRSHNCGELRKSDVGKEVRLAGWIHSVRDHGGVIFIDLRDHYGLTQVVIDPEQNFYQALDKWQMYNSLPFAQHMCICLSSPFVLIRYTITLY